MVHRHEALEAEGLSFISAAPTIGEPHVLHVFARLIRAAHQDSHKPHWATMLHEGPD